MFPELGIKGLKLKLKGKISAAGNSRKRCIIYRVGKTSHSTFNLRVSSEIDTVITFTGVMGLTVSVFY
jgi:ribosomal protein S3